MNWQLRRCFSVNLFAGSAVIASGFSLSAEALAKADQINRFLVAGSMVNNTWLAC